ncbi:bacteriophage abortive infection AbiH family protein [Sedimentitalea sp. HM32M-2]|uniref:bacteriophage abortive infection AbiH family protein n=1 Tax=Sedimentitalea sp. HM32M-2 TaxID=3351566 RepID=UPI0036308B56
MTEKLFIIGNGFDLHHGIPSGYGDFGRYVEQNDPATFQLINEYLFVDEDFWYCLEERLATFDSDKILDHAANFLVSYGVDDWSDADHHNYEYEIQQVAGGLSCDMRDRFADWVRSLPIPNAKFSPKIACVSPEAHFLNFNYTPTLQQAYNVPDQNVLHIHGRASEPNSKLVLGHGWERDADESLSRYVDEDTDTRVAGGYHLIDQYFADTFKPAGSIIALNKSFFTGLQNVREIWVLGHSLADVDAA